MKLENWDEVRTAYHVARMRTVSGAAEVLGVHHATVIRHVDALEGRLGIKLFQRHARGYTPTEAGEDLLQVAQTTADQFEQLAGRLHGRGASVTGELVVTSLEILSPLLAEALAGFALAHPELTVRFLTDTRPFRLEYGEAHVAVRAGSKPEEPDNIVQGLPPLQVALYARTEYRERHGPLEPDWDCSRHRFVATTESRPRAPFDRWLAEHLSPQCIVYRSSELFPRMDAVAAGAGIGFMPVYKAARTEGLVQMAPPRPAWQVPLWLITHVDLHRTAKVQSFTAHLKEAAKVWPTG